MLGYESHGSFIQRTGGSPRGVSNDFPITRHSSVLINAGHFERLIIGKRGMATCVNQVHRVVRRYFVQRLVSLKPFDHFRFGGPFALMPAAPDNPLARLCLVHRFSHVCHQLIKALCLA